MSCLKKRVSLWNSNITSNICCYYNICLVIRLWLDFVVLQVRRVSEIHPEALCIFKFKPRFHRHIEIRDGNSRPVVPFLKQGSWESSSLNGSYWFGGLRITSLLFPNDVVFLFHWTVTSSTQREGSRPRVRWLGRGSAPPVLRSCHFVR